VHLGIVRMRLLLMPAILRARCPRRAIARGGFWTQRRI